MTNSNKYLESKKYMIDHFKELGSLKNDFRIYNLTTLIASKVKGDKVLDIGCGNGFLLGILSKKGIETFGIEPNKDLIKLAKNTNPRLKIFEGYAHDIDKIKHKVDTITIIDVLEHIEDDKLQIKRMHNHLNESGRLIIVVPAFQLLYGKRDENLGHYRRYSKKEIIQKLSKIGFKIHHIRYWNMLGFFPYLFYEKILKKELNTELRTEKKKGIFKKLLSNLLFFWFKYIENNFSLGFGLSLVCVAEKTRKNNFRS
tara:strand:+ start:2948 stop:3715 length:768 start_codon:yes stop_codon:yes gene_type:complete